MFFNLNFFVLYHLFCSSVVFTYFYKKHKSWNLDDLVSTVYIISITEPMASRQAHEISSSPNFISWIKLICTVRKVLAYFAVCDWWRYCKALCDVKCNHMEECGRKFRHIELSCKQSSVTFSDSDVEEQENIIYCAQYVDIFLSSYTGFMTSFFSCLHFIGI